MLVHESSVSQDVGRHILYRVLRCSSANELQPAQSISFDPIPTADRQNSPLHVPPLCPTKRHDPLLGEHVERKRVDPLLVDDDKVLLLADDVAVLVELRVAHELLEFDDLADLGVGELALRLDELLALLCGRVEEARVDLAVIHKRTSVLLAPMQHERNARLLVLERNVESEDVAVLETLGHVGVPSPVIEDESLDETSVDVGEVLHFHELDHVEVDRLISNLLLPLRLDLVLSLDRALLPNLVDDAHLADGKNRIDETLCETLGETLVELGGERGVGDVDEDLVGGVVVGKGDAERVEEGGEAVLGDFNPVGENARVDALGGVSLGLLKELAWVGGQRQRG